MSICRSKESVTSMAWSPRLLIPSVWPVWPYGSLTGCAYGIGLDLHSLIRAALLHDYFLYDWHAHDGGRHRMHGFTHGGTAMRNAVRDFHLNRVERDSIENHMFPLTPIPPRYLEGYLVTVADKISATRETVSLERFYKPKVNMHTSGK